LPNDLTRPFGLDLGDEVARIFIELNIQTSTRSGQKLTHFGVGAQCLGTLNLGGRSPFKNLVCR
jgi:hypothetical protein